MGQKYMDDREISLTPKELDVVLDGRFDLAARVIANEITAHEATLIAGLPTTTLRRFIAKVLSKHSLEWSAVELLNDSERSDLGTKVRVTEGIARSTRDFQSAVKGLRP